MQDKNAAANRKVRKCMLQAKATAMPGIDLRWSDRPLKQAG
jgi:hypothetical protein